ncbi:flagellar biosynthetic protein [Sphingopyxis sp. YF1]|jgi:flagellar assembly protein FliH|uniref:FliH/SctL family protein n=1 Tax=Sphingopyxis sp. YF1 TaxID=2482763 RepID=UPI001F6229F2|nr:FliH/SctL family protein [Sphingopyxis sp. YF1]UNU43111.1 flagellar biosynthetic protein [Sphingopyxis sp. YF1]
MSDQSFAPTALAMAMAKPGGFRPLSFDPAVRARETADAVPPPVEAEPGEDPFEKGLAEGQRLAEAAFAVERAQLLALVAGAEALQDEPSEELAQLIAETVERLVRQIVVSAPIDAEWLKDQAEIAAALVAEADKARSLWVHPQDAALLMDANIRLPIEADPAMLRGTVRIETSAGWIEHGRAVYLNELRAALGREDDAA